MSEASGLLSSQAEPRFRACIGMGGNLGDVRAHLHAALDGLCALPNTVVVGVSALYETKPVDSSGPDYLNAVAVIDTPLAPQALLDQLLALEVVQDRTRPYHNAPRTLDLDLLCHGDARMATTTLTLPHPRMAQRAFVLEPLVDVMARIPVGAGYPDLVLPDLPSAAERATLAHMQGIVRLADAW